MPPCMLRAHKETTAAHTTILHFTAHSFSVSRARKALPYFDLLVTLVPFLFAQNNVAITKNYDVFKMVLWVLNHHLGTNRGWPFSGITEKDDVGLSQMVSSSKRVVMRPKQMNEKNLSSPLWRIPSNGGERIGTFMKIFGEKDVCQNRNLLT